jgi:hypothetical protein
MGNNYNMSFEFSYVSLHIILICMLCYSTIKLIKRIIYDNNNNNNRYSYLFGIKYSIRRLEQLTYIILLCLICLIFYKIYLSIILGLLELILILFIIIFYPPNYVLFG